MSEWCLDCWNKLNDSQINETDVKLSKDTTLCEGCGTFKNVILKIKRGHKNEISNIRKTIKRP